MMKERRDFVNLTLDTFKEMVKDKVSVGVTQEWWDNNYKDASTEVKMICPKHGKCTRPVIKFMDNTTPCKKCLTDKSFLTRYKSCIKDISKYKRFNTSKYKYLPVEDYRKSGEIHFICPIHGEFKVKLKNCYKYYDDAIERHIPGRYRTPYLERMTLDFKIVKECRCPECNPKGVSSWGHIEKVV